MVHLLDVAYESYFILAKSHKYSEQTVEQVWPLCPVLIKYVTHVVCATVKHLLDVAYESYFILTKSHKYSEQTVEQVWPLCPVLIK